MELSIRQIGRYGSNPAKMIELTVSDSGTTITTDVTDLKGKVDEGLIVNLMNIVDELEEQNELIKNQKNK